MTTTSEIRITGEPLPVPAMCRFIVDRPVYANRSHWFGSREAAELSPLAKRLFEIPGIAQVLISHQTVTLTKNSPVPWPQIGPQIGAAIRAFLMSGEPAVPDSLRESLPAPDELRRRVEQVIAREIAPSVAQHGGSITVLGVEDNNVLLKMGGGCQGCASASATLRYGVESAIRRAVPEIGEIIDTTDHAAGTNPWFRTAR